jgi:small subunit ribosomal protein S4
MHGGTERASHIPFPLNPETRSDVIPVRLHFRETIPQARQPISHRKIRVNNEMGNITRSKVSSYHSELLLLLKRRNGKNRIPTRTMSLIVNNGNLCSDSTYCSESPYCDTRKIRIRGIELPTHYSEVNHRTPKAVVSYGPDIGHIPHDIRLKDPNLPLRSRNERGRNNYYL